MKTNLQHKREHRRQPARPVTLFTLLCVATLARVGILLAQGQAGSSYHPTYDLSKPPPVNLIEAYGLALTHLGEATNRVHCLTATCRDGDGARSAAWTLEFSNTNGHHAVVKVFLSDKSVWIDPSTASALK
jgi:hypothetical protein